MAHVETSISEAEILTRVIGPVTPGLSPDAARSLLDLRFDAEDQQRIRLLLDKNNRGIITEAERGEMEKYLRVGTFLDLVQAKARLSLHNDPSAP